jgi:hypothetical protein
MIYELKIAKQFQVNRGLSRGMANAGEKPKMADVINKVGICGTISR